MTAHAALDPRPAIRRVLADLASCPPVVEEQMAWVVARDEEMDDEDYATLIDHLRDCPRCELRNEDDSSRLCPDFPIPAAVTPEVAR